MSSASSFIGKRSASASRYMSEINVTPFVDVMLVLLVIFMIAAPLMTTGVEVDLPEARTDQLASDHDPVAIVIDAGGQVFLGDALIAPDDFQPVLLRLAQASGDPARVRVFVSADRTLDYGLVMTIVSRIAEAGFTRIAFLSDSRTSGERQFTP